MQAFTACPCSMDMPHPATGSSRIALALYGLPRGTNLTSGPLHSNVLTPLRSLGCVDIFLIVTVTAGRTDARRSTDTGKAIANGALGWEAAAAFGPCKYEIIDQDAALLERRVREPIGPDTWNDGHLSVRNHLLELYSLRALGFLIRAQEAHMGGRYSHAAVARIDTRIDTHPVDFRALRRLPPPFVVVPVTGTEAAFTNDRFAYGDRDSIVDVHLHRYDMIGPASAVHAETLLCCVLRERRVGIYGQSIMVERLSGAGMARDKSARIREKGAFRVFNQRADGHTSKGSFEKLIRSSFGRLVHMTSPFEQRCVGNVFNVHGTCWAYSCAETGGLVATRGRPASKSTPSSSVARRACDDDDESFRANPWGNVSEAVMTAEASPATADAERRAGVDCTRLVPAPVDTSPIRSPQAVHSALASRVQGMTVAEIGTRTGDAMACFSAVARSAVAIELDAAYCSFLRERSSRQPTSHRYQVHCGSGVGPRAIEKLQDAQVIIWWQPPSVVTMLPFLGTHASALRAGVQAVTLFDQAYHGDQVAWAFLQPLASWHELVHYDECTRCVETHARGAFTENVTCARAVGAFVLAGFAVGAQPAEALSTCLPELTITSKLAKRLGVDAAFEAIRKREHGRCTALVEQARTRWRNGATARDARKSSAWQCRERQLAACSSLEIPPGRCGAVRGTADALDEFLAQLREQN